jgi:hypothetical protein
MNATKCKSCGSCGMALEKAADFAQGDTSSQYCAYCTDTKGKLLPYQEIFSTNVKYYKDSQGISDAAAEKFTKEFLATMPAWKSQPST